MVRVVRPPSFLSPPCAWQGLDTVTGAVEVVLPGARVARTLTWAQAKALYLALQSVLARGVRP